MIRIKRYISIALGLLAVSQAKSAPIAEASRPTLFLSITVNGLDYDKIVELAPYMTSDGFRRVMENGVTVPTIDFGSRLDDAAAMAVVMTGAAPAVNGITGRTRFDAETRRVTPIVYDSSQLGNYTDETFSPAAIRVSTMADEVRLDAGGLGNVYSLAPDATQAIVGAGHAGNSACWITDDSGKWATTTWYKDLPTPVSGSNHRNPLYLRLDTMAWTPSVKEAAFSHLPSYKKIYPFRHTFLRSSPDRYRAFKMSAAANAEVTTLAIDYLKVMNLGRREPIDMLSLVYTLQPYNFGRDADNRAELIDAYIRLDRDLARLFKAVDTVGPGMNQAVVLIAGTPVAPETIADDIKWGIPTGEFSPERALSLLKVNLMSIYGNGDWVIGYHDKQFFLNRQLIKDKGLSLEEVARESADFLRKMSGVTYAATLKEVINGTDDGLFPPARNLDVDTAGDLFIAVAPGWTVSDASSPGRPSLVERQGASTSSVMILAPGITPTVVDQVVDARAVSPTISRLLRVRAPNGSSLPPLRL